MSSLLRTTTKRLFATEAVENYVTKSRPGGGALLVYGSPTEWGDKICRVFLGVWAVLSLLTFACLSASPAAADDCPTSKDEIATDRPDVTNSSLVVPTGSLQAENGINLSGRDSATLLDATNTRLRLGCLEVLVDVPTYFAVLGGDARSGWTNVIPAIKWQISPVPGKIDLSAVVGAGLPTGTRNIAGSGVQPYLQFPWSWKLGHEWELAGMITDFFTPPMPTRLPRRRHSRLRGR